MRRAAAAALGRAAARSDEALGSLRTCVDSADGAVREGAAAAFGYLLRRRTGEALEALNRLARDGEARVRAAASNALALAPRRAADRALAALAGCAETDAGSTELGGAHQAMACALAALARYRPAKALARLREGAAHPSELCRWAVARALGMRALARRPGARRLAELLAADSVPSVRHGVAQALGRASRRAPGAWQMALLRRLLKDVHRLVRSAAAEALGPLAIAFPEAGLPLLTALAEDRDPYLRMGAAHAAGEMARVDPVLALRLLSRLASDRDVGVRRGAAAALRLLACSRPHETAPLVWRLMRDSQAQVRAAAVRTSVCLLSSHAAETAQALAARASDPNPQVRRATAEALYAVAPFAPEPSADAALTLLADQALRDACAAVLARASDACPERTVTWLLDGFQAAGDVRFLDALVSCYWDERAAAMAAAGKEVAQAQVAGLSAAITRLADTIESAERLGAGKGSAAVIRLLAVLFQARTLDELVAAAQAVLGLCERAPNMTADSQDYYARLCVMARLVARAHAARRTDDRVRNLAAAKSLCDEVLATLPASLDPIRQRAWRGAFVVPSAILGAALEAAQGRATVQVALVTRQAVRRERLTLLLDLENVGAGPARNVRVEPQPGPGYHALGDPPTLAVLYPGECRRVAIEIAVAPGLSRLAGATQVVYEDEQGATRLVRGEGEVVLLDPAQPFRPIENPYLPGKPLEPGSPLFFGRQAIFRFLKSALGASAQANVVVLCGERRIGKTSILRQLEGVLGEQFFPVFIDTQGLLVDTVPLFLYQLAYHTFKSLRHHGVVRDLPAHDDFARSPGLLYDQLAQAAQGAESRRLLIMLDEFDDLQYKVSSGLLPPEIFDHLRHLMQHLPNCAFVLSGTHRIEDLAGDYWSFLFSLALHRTIRVLGGSSAMELVQQPMAQAGVVCEDLAAANVCALTGGHPYLTQLACHMLVEQCNEDQRLVIEAEHVEEVGRELLRWGEAQLRYWWDTAFPAERAVLAVAAESPEAAESLTAESAANRLAAAGAVLDTGALHGALERLVGHDLLAARGKSGFFRLSTELAGRWVRARWPVERVACALRDGLWNDGSARAS